MTKQEVLNIKNFFQSRNIEILQICLLLDVVMVRYSSGKCFRYKLENFRNSNKKK